MKKIFGYELLLDCYDCDPSTMEDVTIGYDFLDGAVTVLGVHKMTPPYVFKAPDGYANSGGTSGWVGIIESGIQFHAMAEKNFCSIDYYTCSVIDKKVEKSLIQFAKNMFAPKKVVSQLILRGTSYYD